MDGVQRPEHVVTEPAPAAVTVAQDQSSGRFGNIAVRRANSSGLSLKLVIPLHNFESLTDFKRRRMSAPVKHESGTSQSASRSGSIFSINQTCAAYLGQIPASEKDSPLPSQAPDWFSGFHEAFECLAACQTAFRQPEKVREFLKGEGPLYNRLILTLIELDRACENDQLFNQDQQQDIVHWLNLSLKNIPIPWQQLPLVYNPAAPAWNSERTGQECLNTGMRNLELQKQLTGKDCFIPAWMETRIHGLPVADVGVVYHNIRNNWAQRKGSKSFTPTSFFNSQSMTYDWMVLFGNKEKTVDQLKHAGFRDPDIFYTTACEYLSDIDDQVNSFLTSKRKKTFNWQGLPKFPGMQARINRRLGKRPVSASERKPVCRPVARRSVSDNETETVSRRRPESSASIGEASSTDRLVTKRSASAAASGPPRKEKLSRTESPLKTEGAPATTGYSLNITGDALIRLGSTEFREPLETYKVNGATLANIILEGLWDIVHDSEGRMDEEAISDRLDTAFQYNTRLIMGAYEVQKSLERKLNSEPETVQAREAMNATAVCQGAIGELYRIDSIIEQLRNERSEREASGPGTLRQETSRQESKEPAGKAGKFPMRLREKTGSKPAVLTMSVSRLGCRTGVRHEEDDMFEPISGKNVFGLASASRAGTNTLKAFFNPQNLQAIGLPEQCETVTVNASRFSNKKNISKWHCIDEEKNLYEISWQDSVELIKESLPRLVRKYRKHKVWNTESGRAELAAMVTLMSNTINVLRPCLLHGNNWLSDNPGQCDSQPSEVDYSTRKQVCKNLIYLSRFLLDYSEALTTSAHDITEKRLTNALSVVSWPDAQVDAPV